MSFKEKNGLEVLVIGKRVIVYNSDAEVVGRIKMNNYAWTVSETKQNNVSFGIV